MKTKHLAAKNRASVLAGVRSSGERVREIVAAGGKVSPKPVHRPVQAHRNLSPKGGFLPYRVS
jgi:hypothetical protein